MLFVENTTYFSNVASKVYLLFAAIHVLFIPLFWVTSIPEMLGFNVFSVVLYGAVFGLNKKGYHDFAFILCVGEVCAHAFLCAFLIGDAGFSGALLALPVLFFISGHKILTKLLFFAAILLAYFGLVVNEQFTTPMYSFDQSILGYFEVITAMLVVIIDSYIAYYAYMIIKLRDTQLDQLK